MSDKKYENSPRRNFLKKTGIGVGAVSIGAFGSLGGALQAFANTKKDAILIKKSVAAVERSAKKGASGRAISLTANYKKLGGENKIVVGALRAVDKSLKAANAFEKYDQKRIDKAVSGALTKYASSVETGDIEVNCGVTKGIGGSALETMVEFGGAGTSDQLNERGFR